MGSEVKRDFGMLRENPDLRDVPDEELNWLLENSQSGKLEIGQALPESFSPNNHLIFVLDGTLEEAEAAAGNYKSLKNYGKGDILGRLPFSKEDATPPKLQASSAAKLLAFPRSQFPRLTSQCPQLTEALVQLMVTRSLTFSPNSLLADKMATLGKLTAGLTHELNHPITAIQRDNAELGRILLKDNLVKLLVIEADLGEGEKTKLEEAIARWSQSARPSSMTASEIQKTEKTWGRQLADWGAKTSEDAAEAFTDHSIDPVEMRQWVEKIDPDKLDSWLDVLACILQARALASNIDRAVSRVSGLIRRVKTFSHFDRAPVRTKLDLLSGIEDSLALLQHRIKASGVEVALSHPDSPALVEGIAGELSQVWTNLIVNALDAMEKSPSPRLRIEILQGKANTAVKISDNGPGIPSELQSRIFQPFFTTKAAGVGTGMGLDLIRQIVERHGGAINLDSRPGETTFEIQLPLS